MFLIRIAGCFLGHSDRMMSLSYCLIQNLVSGCFYTFRIRFFLALSFFDLASMVSTWQEGNIKLKVFDKTRGGDKVSKHWFPISLYFPPYDLKQTHFVHKNQFYDNMVVGGGGGISATNETVEVWALLRYIFHEVGRGLLPWVKHIEKMGMWWQQATRIYRRVTSQEIQVQYSCFSAESPLKWN